MSLTGNYVDAATAEAWGLVNRVVAHEDLVPTCLALGRDIASTNPEASRRLLGLYEATAETTLDEGWRLEGEAARAWSREQLDPAAVGAVRDQVIARGRSQQS